MPNRVARSAGPTDSSARPAAKPASYTTIQPTAEQTYGAAPPPEPGRRSTAQLASGLNVLAGIWLLLAPFALDYRGTSSDAMWNDVIIGASVALLALVRVMSPRATAELSWVNFVLGVWLIFAPLALDYNQGADRVAATANDIILGLIVIGLAAWSATSGRRDRREQDPTLSGAGSTG